MGLNSVSNANQILTCSRSGIVNFKDLIPAFAGMTKHAYDWRDKGKNEKKTQRRKYEKGNIFIGRGIDIITVNIVTPATPFVTPAFSLVTPAFSLVTPAKAGVGLNSVSNANQILTCSRSGIVNFIDLIPAYAGMTKKKAGMTGKARRTRNKT